MQVILSDREFKQAISCWLASQGFASQKYEIDVKVTVGRGEASGTKAEVTLTELTQDVETVTVAAPIEDAREEEPTAGSGIARPFFSSEE